PPPVGKTPSTSRPDKIVSIISFCPERKDEYPKCCCKAVSNCTIRSPFSKKRMIGLKLSLLIITHFIVFLHRQKKRFFIDVNSFSPVFIELECRCCSPRVGRLSSSADSLPRTRASLLSILFSSITNFKVILFENPNITKSDKE